MKIGIVIADEYEYVPFLEIAKKYNCKESIRQNRDSVEFELNGNNITAIKCGIGKVNAATATAFLISEDKCDIIFNIGLSGAISQLEKEDFVVGETFIECDFDLSPLGYAIGKKPQKTYEYTADEKLRKIALSIPGLKSGKLGTGDFFLTDTEKKHLYKNTFGIKAFDMETGAIASVCNDCNIPFLSIRKISDTADDTATETYTQTNNKCESDLTEIIISVINKL